MGSYDSPAPAERRAAEPIKTKEEPKNEVKPAPASAPAAPVRQVISENDFLEEERETLQNESGIKAKNTGAASTPAPVKHEEKHITTDDLLNLARESAAHEQKATAEAKPQEEKPATVAAKPAPAKEAPVKKEAKKEVKKEEPKEPSDEIAVDRIEPNPSQPRTAFRNEELDELSSSIKKDGLLQPILVRKMGDKYQIIAGERRWQAAQRAGLKKVPVRIIKADDDKALELALIENLQRSDLNPIEEAYGYKRMMERGNKTQSEVAAAVSKGRSTIANALRLLELPEDAQEMLYEDKITAGHARAILSIPSDEGKKKLTDKLKSEKLSVREAENLARLYAGRQKTNTLKTKVPVPAVFKSTAKVLTEAFGTKVRVKSNANGKNKIEIEFKDEAELKRILEIMNQDGE